MEKNNRRMMYQKLSDNLSITARVLEDVVRRFAAEERRHLEAQKALPGMGVAAGDVAGGESDGAGLGFDQEDQRKTLRNVDENLSQLQRIYTDLANCASEQQASFERLETDIASASDVERGQEEIMFAGKYDPQAGWRNGKMWVAGGSLAFLAGLAFFASG